MNSIPCRLFIPNTKGEPVRPLSAFFLSFLASACSGAANAQISDNLVRIGVLGDLSGVYADFGGPGNVVAARMAVEDFGGKVLGKPIDVIAADHQSKADIGAAIARQWFDADKVDMAIGFDNSSIALAVEQVAFQKNRIAIAGAVSTTVFTGKNCTPNEAAWLHDNYALANTLARSVVRRGGDTWFFITVDYTFGHSLEAEAKNAVLASGGKVLGAVRHPLNNPDFSSYLLQAQASGAKVVALANAGGDMTNATKQANDFGLSRAGNQSLVSLLVFITDIHSLGLAVTQGLQFATAFYWDRDDESRAWSKRFFAIHQRMPTSAHAAVYSATRHYLRAIEAAGTDEAKAVMAKMREMPINDFFAKNGKLREDGRMVHDMYLVEVKTPAESSGPWDYYKIIAMIPGDQAFRPAGEDGCPLIKR
jgi:branched-chain amino acid transport system substrate-binding protein